MLYLFRACNEYIVCIGYHPLPIKNTTPRPFPHLKIEFFSETHIKFFLSLTTSHLLKVTKFLVEISQFKFLVMAEKSIFAL